MFNWAVACDCGWSYPRAGQNTVAFKMDCEEQVRAHRLAGCQSPIQVMA